MWLIPWSVSILQSCHCVVDSGCSFCLFCRTPAVTDIEFQRLIVREEGGRGEVEFYVFLWVWKESFHFYWMFYLSYVRKVYMISEFTSTQHLVGDLLPPFLSLLHKLNHLIIFHLSRYNPQIIWSFLFFTVCIFAQYIPLLAVHFLWSNQNWKLNHRQGL